MKITIKELKVLIKDVIKESKMINENVLSSTWKGAAQSVLHDNKRGNIKINPEVYEALKEIAQHDINDDLLSVIMKNKWTYKDNTENNYALRKVSSDIVALKRG